MAGWWVAHFSSPNGGLSFTVRSWRQIQNT